MTIENNVFTVKSKRKEHPNATKYPGKPSMEFGTALRSFMSDIGPTNLNALIEGKYIFDMEVSAKFFDSIQIGDVIGLGLVKGFNEVGENRHNEPAAYKFKVLDISKQNDTMKVRNVTFESEKGKHKGLELELAFEDLSSALGMGFGEILERDGKPYGVSEEIELKVKIVNLNPTGSIEAQQSTAQNNLPQTTETVSTTQEEGNSNSI